MISHMVVKALTVSTTIAYDIQPSRGISTARAATSSILTVHSVQLWPEEVRPNVGSVACSLTALVPQIHSTLTNTTTFTRKHYILHFTTLHSTIHNATFYITHYTILH